jgi:hypothetical protein
MFRRSIIYSFLAPRSGVLHGKLNGFQLVKKWPAFYGTQMFITAFTSVSQSISPGPRCVFMFLNYARFYDEDLSAHRPNSKLENHNLSAVRNCLSNIFATTLLIGGRSSIRNPWTRHAMVTGTLLSRVDLLCLLNCITETSSGRGPNALDSDLPSIVRWMWSAPCPSRQDPLCTHWVGHKVVPCLDPLYS